MDKGFLPEGYKAPVGDYMKFEDGETTFRVMSSAIVGYSYWTSDDKPVRMRKEPLSTPADIRVKDGKPERVKHFWAFVVWNVEAQKIQILEVVQQTIQAAIKAYVANKKWGDPKGYDITVKREGSGFDTEYTIMANPHTPVDPAAAEAFKARHVNLQALYDNGDPFASVASPEGQSAEEKADDDAFAQAGGTGKPEAPANLKERLRSPEEVAEGIDIDKMRF
jgi:hypothetical protein